VSSSLYLLSSGELLCRLFFPTERQCFLVRWNNRSLRVSLLQRRQCFSFDILHSFHCHRDRLWDQQRYHFNVPDLRGRFARGWNDGAGNDPDAATRIASNTGGATGDNVGSLQADTLISHTHMLYYSYYVGGMLTGSSQAGQDTSAGMLASEVNSPGGASAETRPKNVGLMPIIKT